MKKQIAILLVVLSTLISCQQKTSYDTIIRNGLVYDGNGGEPFKDDIAIQNDSIAFIGDLSNATAKNEVDAKGLAVAPGFINMMGHSEESLFQDGRAQSDIRQGVTTEIFGESSFGPLNANMKNQMQNGQGDVRYNVGIHWANTCKC
jgi:N-acyl-D-amino-acid deacylase